MTERRVLHVLPSVVPTDGIARAVRELAARIPGEHHLVTNRAHGPFPWFVSLTEVGGANGRFTFSHARAVREVVERVDPHIVHLHGGSLATTMAFSPAFSDRPIVVGIQKWLSAPDWAELNPAGWRQRRASSVPPLLAVGSTLAAGTVNRMAARRRLDGIVSPDPRIVDRLSAHTRTPVVFAPGGAATDDVRAVYAPDGPTIGFAGKAESARGVDLLLGAFELVVRRVPGAKLSLSLLPSSEVDTLVRRVGLSPHREAISLSTEPVADVRMAFARCQVAVFPFRIDATITPTLSAAEALSVGVPVVASDVGCLAPLIEPGRNGALVPVGDIDALADAIVATVSSADHWQTLSDGALETIAERWSWDGAAARIDALYRHILHPRLVPTATQIGPNP